MMSNFVAELNKNTVEALMNGAAFFIKPQETTLPFISNSFTGNPITGANYFNLMLSNDINGTRHTEYVKMNAALSSQPEWLSTLPRENRPMGALFQEESMGSNSRYSFVMPTAQLNQNLYFDRQENAMPRDHYVPFQSHNAPMSDFGAFIHEQFTNAINASFTNGTFRSNIPENAIDQFKTQLIGEIAKNPNFIAEASNRAHQEVMNLHYVPLDRKNFIEQARNETSNAFSQLNSAISGHVEDMYANRKPSFNREFNEIARPLVTQIETIHRNNPEPQPAVEHEVTRFIKENMKQDKTAAVIADTYAGTYVEKAQKIARIGKIVVTGAALAGAIITSNFPAAVGIAGSLISEIAKKPKIPEHIPEQHKVVINNRELNKNELEKILNFDNAPFSLTGKDKVGNRDYEIARQAEKAILAMDPAINKDEYHRNMTCKQAVDFVRGTAEKMEAGSDKDFRKVADTITTLQGLKGDNTLKSCRDNPRSFLANLNNTVRNNPHVLQQAVAQVKTIKNTVSHVASMSRR